MVDLGLDPETALKLIQMLLCWAAYFFAGFALVGLSVYLVFLCLEIFSLQRRSEPRRANAPRKAGAAPDTVKNLDLPAAETPIPVNTETLGTGTVRRRLR